MSTVNVPEAANLLKVHPKTVLELINTGAIPAAKIGRSFVMLERDVMNHIEEQVLKQTIKRRHSPQTRSQVTAA